MFLPIQCNSCQQLLKRELALRVWPGVDDGALRILVVKIGNRREVYR